MRPASYVYFVVEGNFFTKDTRALPTLLFSSFSLLKYFNRVGKKGKVGGMFSKWFRALLLFPSSTSALVIYHAFHE